MHFFLFLFFQGDLDEEIPESCSSSDDDLELDETNLGEGNASHAYTICRCYLR